MSAGKHGSGVECYLSQEEVGKLLGLTKQRVNQLEGRALRKLRMHPIIRKLAVEYGLVEEGLDVHRNSG